MDPLPPDAATLARPVGWALAGGALILLHLWLHPLAKIFRESLRWLSLHPLLVLVSAASITTRNWPDDITRDTDLTYPNWTPLLWQCLEKGIHRFAWLFHDIMHRGALYHAASLLLAVALVFRVKCFQQEGVPFSKRAPSIAFFLILIFACAAMLAGESGWIKAPDFVRAWVPLPAEALTLAMTQLFCSRFLVDSMIVDRPALPALAETSRRWAAVLGLAALNAIALWMEDSSLAQMPVLRRWIEPEFLLLICLLPLVAAGTKYPFFHCGGLAVTLLGKLGSPLISIAVSGAVMLAWIEFAMLAARDYFSPIHHHICAAAGALVCSLAQCWIFVTCGLLLLRSGYLEPEEPPP